MKYKILFLYLIIIAFSLNAQQEITHFLGIPVDGPKKEVVKSLKNKGFKKTSENSVLEGIFNGKTSYIHVFETNGKVSRIAVTPKYYLNVRDAIKEFNNLCYQFIEKDNYIVHHPDIIIPTYKDIAIPSDEDIAYEMSVHNKNYQVALTQLPLPLDSLLKEEEPSNHYISMRITKEDGNKIDGMSYLKILDKYSKNSVWFSINEDYGKYYIILYYDNNNNRLFGDDL